MKLAINGGNPAISEIIDDWKDIQKDDIRWQELDEQINSKAQF